MRAGGYYSLFIIQYYGILRVWFPGTAQIISKKEVWLVFQGNNEGRSGRLKQTREVTSLKLTFKFVWPYSPCFASSRFSTVVAAFTNVAGRS
jgi:hypothetical protein